MKVKPYLIVKRHSETTSLIVQWPIDSLAVSTSKQSKHTLLKERHYELNQQDLSHYFLCVLKLCVKKQNICRRFEKWRKFWVNIVKLVHCSALHFIEQQTMNWKRINMLQYGAVHLAWAGRTNCSPWLPWMKQCGKCIKIYDVHFFPPISIELGRTEQLQYINFL
jgi:hypothetical protein